MQVKRYTPQGVQATIYGLKAREVRERARMAAYHKGAAMKYQDIANEMHGVDPRFICEQAELAGYSVWASAPESALYAVSEDSESSLFSG